MKKIMIVAIAVAAFCGCSVTKVNYEKDETGKVSYRLYRNDHWLKTSGTGIKGGMSEDGKFEFAADGLEKSPSEEFNRTMQTYTTAFVQLAQIAAAAYNPSASAASGAAKTGNDGGGAPLVETPSGQPSAGGYVATQTVVNVQPAAAGTTNAVETVEAK